MTDWEAKRAYEGAKTRYSVRFFRESRGVEKRPDDLQGQHTEGWEGKMDLELALAREMIRRTANSTARGPSTGMDPSFTSAGTEAEIRAVAACASIERDHRFPFTSLTKEWSAASVLKRTTDLTMQARRHAALLNASGEPTSDVERMGIVIRDGRFILRFGRLSVERLFKFGVGDLVEGIQVPFGALARLDGFGLNDVEEVIDWLSTFLQKVRIIKDTFRNLEASFAEHGVEVGYNIFNIDPTRVSIEGIKGIVVPEILPGVGVSFADLMRLNKISFQEVQSPVVAVSTVLSDFLSSGQLGHSNVRERRKLDRAAMAARHREEQRLEREEARLLRRRSRVKGGENHGQIRSSGAEEDQAAERQKSHDAEFEMTIHRLKSLFTAMKLSREREDEIEKLLMAGDSLDEFLEEIVKGYQAYFFNVILRNRLARKLHMDRPEIITDLLGEVNLNVIRRKIKIPKAGDSGEGFLKKFMYVCAISAIKDAARSGIDDGISMTGRVERLINYSSENIGIAERALFESGAQDMSENEKNSTSIPVNFAQTRKSPDGITITCRISKLEEALARAHAKRIGYRSPLDLKQRSHAKAVSISMQEALFDADENLVRQREVLLRRLYTLIEHAGNDLRGRAILKLVVRRILGLDHKSLAELGDDFGISHSRVSQLATENEEFAKDLLRRHFTFEEAMLMYGKVESE